MNATKNEWTCECGVPGIGPTTVRRYESPSPLWDKEKSRPVHTTFVAKLLRLFYPKSEEKKSNQTDIPHYSHFIFPNVKVKQESEICTIREKAHRVGRTSSACLFNQHQECWNTDRFSNMLWSLC